MIAPAYVQTMARYNEWQNKQLVDIIDVMDQVELDRDRGAFFGSIQRTLSHLLWGDRLWMARFDINSEAPEACKAGGIDMWPSKLEWSSGRIACDDQMRKWSDGLKPDDLRGDLAWYSALSKSELRKPLTFCIMHFLNHQTHHRGQVHAMLTAAGMKAPVSDLVFMP